MGKFLAKIIKSLDINEDEIAVGEEEKIMAMMGQQAQAAGGTQGPNMQSQIPQMAAQQSMDTVESMIPRADMGGLQGKAEGGMK
jgi:hypothetical protein